MSLLRIKQLFAAGTLSLLLVGCSSTPTTDDSEVVSTDTTIQTTTGAADAEAAVEAEALSEAARVEDATEADRMADLYASLQGQRVHFDFDRSEIKDEFVEIVKKHAEYLAFNTEAKVTLEGHCDERGTREYNLALGERRANAVKNALIAEGVDPSRINVISFGKDMPLIDQSNEAAWQQNRRAEFVY